MTLFYRSTRDKNNQVTASQAILQGLAADGGLYVPSEMPEVALDFASLAKMTYQEVALLIMKAFLTDFTEQELHSCIAAAYDDKFSDKQIAPLKKVGSDYYLELFHGATIAFKDMALSILPHLMTTAAKKNQVNRDIVILTATSGDTGKAAMAGFADVPGTKIIVFYPKSGVSQIQERQMLTQTGENTYVVGITGNFDDAQTNVKRMFNNIALREKLHANGIQFSSANSINIGRLVPQIVYYVYAYAQLIAKQAVQQGEAINVCVPTGNFGNILAAYYARKIGVPIGKLICASNKNNVLTDFFNRGVYDRRRQFFVTSSPSMDILVSSNLERLLFELSGESDQVTSALMAQLAETGEYQLTDEMKQGLQLFYANYATEEETAAEISRLFEATGYVADPHTAVAAKVLADYRNDTGDKRVSLIAATASPYKFPRAVVEAIQKKTATADDFTLVDTLQDISGVPIPDAVSSLEKAAIRHDTVVAPEEMEQTVATILGVADEV